MLYSAVVLLLGILAFYFCDWFDSDQHKECGISERQLIVLCAMTLFVFMFMRTKLVSRYNEKYSIVSTLHVVESEGMPRLTAFDSCTIFRKCTDYSDQMSNIRYSQHIRDRTTGSAVGVLTSVPKHPAR